MELPPRVSAEIVYKKAKLGIKYLIINAKRNLWKRLIKDLNENIWGDGFKIVMRHLKKFIPPYNPSATRKLEIEKQLEKRHIYSRRR